MLLVELLIKDDFDHKVKIVFDVNCFILGYFSEFSKYMIFKNQK
jgi:hypothetical protein